MTLPECSLFTVRIRNNQQCTVNSWSYSYTHLASFCLLLICSFGSTSLSSSLLCHLFLVSLLQSVLVTQSLLSFCLGKPIIERVTPTPHTQGTPAPGLPHKCSAKADAIVTTEDKKTLFFSGEYFWEIGDYGAGEPQKIKNAFPMLEENLDAAYTSRKEGHTFFFKGAK